MEEKLGEAIGKDFLFLFDLIAENFGKVSPGHASAVF